MAPSACLTEIPAAVQSFVDLLYHRKTRRFGCGMELPTQPLSYRSHHDPIPLTPEEEEYLIFAGVGATGLNLGDMQFHRQSRQENGHGIALMNLESRTVPSACAAQTTRLFYTNDDGVFFVHQSPHPSSGSSPRVQRLQSGRLDIPRTLPFMLSFNQWYTNRPGSTYFMPITNITQLYLNLLLVVLSEEYGYFFVDTDNGNAPCGLDRFRRSRGGHLHDDPSTRRMLTLRELDATISDVAVQEQGIICQNMLLMQQALGLGGGMQSVGSGRHLLGMEPQVFRGLGFQFVYPTRPGVLPNPLGLSGIWEGPVTSDTTSMDGAVRAVVESKFGERGIYRNGHRGPWSNPEVPFDVQPHSDRAVEAAIALGNYVLQTYGRFPAHADAFRSIVACQAHHLDVDFYDTFYPDHTLPDPHRDHLAVWHGMAADQTQEVTL
jgi:hypothetical protein